ncbi:MAG TPA: C45 family peptidase [Gaiellaceae bacterium]|nr:C45 family peptidase [Gaiellaceae bacterium]
MRGLRARAPGEAAAGAARAAGDASLSEPIPLLQAAGSHREVGAQLGLAAADAIRRAAAAPFDAELVERYRAVTMEHLAWVVEELDAAAEAAGLDPLAVFAASVEELESAPAPTGCTDLVAAADATADGHLLVAHNNDLGAEDEDDVAAIEWRVPGDPLVFTLGVGPWASVGWNDAGLSVTGNELTPNDERVGIPRLLQMRDVLTRRTLDDAVEAVLHPARASSYNWVLVHASGEVANVEGSASDAAVTEPAAGVLTHANHYAHPRMLRYERSPRAALSRARACRADELLAGRDGSVTVAWLREALADHEGAPDSLCRHGDEEGTKTVFWCVADVTAGEITYGRGNPCSSTPQSYRFER